MQREIPIRFHAIVFGLPLLLLAGCASDSGGSDSSAAIAETEGALTGGQPALDSQIPSTVWMNGCTAAKVGPKHFLLAAHCVNNSDTGQVGDGYLPGRLVPMTANHTYSSSVVRNLTIDKTSIFPLWTSTWPYRPTCYYPAPAPCPNVLNPYHPPDIAVLMVKETTPDIPIASVDETPAVGGDQVIITGYGCENGVHGAPPDVIRLKLGLLSALPSVQSPDPLVGVSPPLTSDDAAIVRSRYVLTQGENYDPVSHPPGSNPWASSCPGDSGGPLYRLSNQLVVGVNAYYSFNDGGNISSVNWHTRVDSTAPDGVLSWLKGLGVSTAATGLKAQYQNLDSAAADNQIKPGIQLVNNTTSSVSLSSVKVRYWFTRDGGSSTYSTYCDYANVGCANLTQSVTNLTTARTGADAYLEVGFTAGAGSLAVGATTGLAQLRVNKSDWSNFGESGDYSYGTNTGTVVDSTKVSVYMNGALVWGAEP